MLCCCTAAALTLIVVSNGVYLHNKQRSKNGMGNDNDGNITQNNGGVGRKAGTTTFKIGNGNNAVTMEINDFRALLDKNKNKEDGLELRLFEEGDKKTEDDNYDIWEGYKFKAVYQLHEAMYDWGTTNEDTLNDILGNSSYTKEQINEIVKYYDESYDKTLKEWIESETSSYYQDLLLTIIGEGEHTRENGGKIDARKAAQLAQQLHEETDAIWDIDEYRINNILGDPSLTPEDIVAIMDAYKECSEGSEFMDDLRANKEGYVAGTLEWLDLLQKRIDTAYQAAGADNFDIKISCENEVDIIKNVATSEININSGDQLSQNITSVRKKYKLNFDELTQGMSEDNLDGKSYLKYLLDAGKITNEQIQYTLSNDKNNKFISETKELLKLEEQTGEVDEVKTIKYRNAIKLCKAFEDGKITQEEYNFYKDEYKLDNYMKQAKQYAGIMDEIEEMNDFTLTAQSTKNLHTQDDYNKFQTALKLLTKCKADGTEINKYAYRALKGIYGISLDVAGIANEEWKRRKNEDTSNLLDDLDEINIYPASDNNNNNPDFTMQTALKLLKYFENNEIKEEDKQKQYIGALGLNKEDLDGAKSELEQIKKKNMQELLDSGEDLETIEGFIDDYGDILLITKDEYNSYIKTNEKNTNATSNQGTLTWSNIEEAAKGKSITLTEGLDDEYYVANGLVTPVQYCLIKEEYGSIYDLNDKQDKNTDNTDNTDDTADFY